MITEALGNLRVSKLQSYEQELCYKKGFLY